MGTCEHVGIGHPRHGEVLIGFAAAVPGGANAHQSRIELILHVTFEDTVLDQGG